MRKLILILASACLLGAPAFAQQNPPEYAVDDGKPRQENRMRHKMFEGMSVEGRKLIAVEMIDSREKMKGNHELRKAMREKVRMAMTAEPYNANALRAAFEEERKMASDQQKVHHEHMVSMLGKLSPADRKIFGANLARLEQGMGGRMKHRRDRDRGDKSGGDHSAPASSM